MVAHATSNPAVPVVVDRAGLAELGIKLSNVWLLQLEKKGQFPRRLKLPGRRRALWLRADIMQYLHDGVAAARHASQG